MSVFAGSYRMPPDFAKRIKRLRQRFSLSQQQFADLIDISISLLKQWENGQAQPSIHYWQRIVLAETDGIQALNNDTSSKLLVHESNIGYQLESEIIPACRFLGGP